MSGKQNKQKKRRKWSLTETVTRVSEHDGIDAEEFGEDLSISGLAVDLYGKKFTDPDEAERFLRRKIREARGDVIKKLATPNTSLSEISESDSGVLDMLIARAEEKLPAIRKKISEHERMLENPELEAYQRGRLERDLSKLKDQEDKNLKTKEQCEKRRNEIWAPEDSKSNEEPDPSTEDSTEGDSPEA